MSELISCDRCGGFLGSNASVCPHCDARPSRARRRRWAVLFGLAGSASLGLTMMACYGCPPGECRGEPTDANSDTSGADGGATN